MAPSVSLGEMRAAQRRLRAERNLAIFRAVQTSLGVPKGVIENLNEVELASLGIDEETITKLRDAFNRAAEKFAHTAEVLTPKNAGMEVLCVLNRVLHNTVSNVDVVCDVRRVDGSYAEGSDFFRDIESMNEEPMTFKENIHASFDIGIEVQGADSRTFPHLKFDGVVGIERDTVDGEERVRYKHVRATATEPYMKAGKSTMDGLQTLFRKLLVAIGTPREAADAFIITWVHTQ